MNQYVNRTMMADVVVMGRRLALIETASWERRKPGGQCLLLGMQVLDADGTSHQVTDVFSQDPKDQERLERLCSALDVDYLFLSNDDLVGRKVLINQFLFRTGQGVVEGILSYAHEEGRFISTIRPII